jgi:cobalt-zinc-cadmium efflux system outer membrane protein
MSYRRLVGLLLSASVVASSAGAEQETPPTYEITFEQAIELARRRSPELVSARARVAEAEAGVGAASIWPFNPQIDASVGPRSGHGDDTTDWSVGGSQWFELGGQGQSRVAAARAGLSAARAQSEDDERLLLRDVGLAFAQALSWEQRLALARENVEIAEEISRVARRRHEVGDVGGLEQIVASLSRTRAQADEARARVELGQVRDRLKILLGLEPEARVLTRGLLRDLVAAGSDRAPDPDARADVRVLAAGLQQAESEIDLARASRIPNVALGATYSREESDDIVLGSLAVALPVFDHGQGTDALASTRHTRIRGQLQAIRRRAVIEVNSAMAAARALNAAVREFEATGLTTLERAEQVAAASYEAGAIPLGELLAVRAELVRAQLNYADLLLAAAVARIELSAATGAWK